jgi:adenosylcobinamide-phosphate synthase
VALLVLLVVVGVVSLVIEQTLLGLPLGLVAAALAASTLLAQRSLFVHVAKVADALDEGDLGAGRAAVAQIVGRDTAELDEAGVARAAIETLAENFSDGVVAPSIWMVIAGIPGAALYKAINTADSMIGHRTERHREFGRTTAQLDDIVNLPASRLSGLLTIAAAYVTKGASAADAWQAMRRDASRHVSPNAGYPEAAMAGALGLALGGPRSYGGKVTDGAWLGDGRREANAADIRSALDLYSRADGLLIALVFLLAAFIALR